MNRTAHSFGLIVAALVLMMIRIWRQMPDDPPPLPPLPHFTPPPAWIVDYAAHAPNLQPPEGGDVDRSLWRRLDSRGADVAVTLASTGHRIPIAVLPFAVTAVASAQRPATRSPWHVAGGAWTFVETPALVLGFSVTPVQFAEGSYESGEAVLQLRDREHATAFMKSLGRYLHLSPAAMPHAIRTLHMRAGVLGRALVRNDDGSFTAAPGGTWTCMKLTIELAAPELYAEIFFSYDPVSQRAELSEKDLDFRGDLMRAFGWAGGA